MTNNELPNDIQTAVLWYREKQHHIHNRESLSSKYYLTWTNINQWDKYYFIISDAGGTGCHGVLSLWEACSSQTTAASWIEASSCAGMNGWDFNGLLGGCKRQLCVERCHRHPSQSACTSDGGKVGERSHSSVEPFTDPDSFASGVRTAQDNPRLF